MGVMPTAPATRRMVTASGPSASKIFRAALAICSAVVSSATVGGVAFTYTPYSCKHRLLHFPLWPLHRRVEGPSQDHGRTIAALPRHVPADGHTRARPRSLVYIPWRVYK